MIDNKHTRNAQKTYYDLRQLGHMALYMGESNVAGSGIRENKI